MNIGIDARPLVEHKTGIGYYLSSLLANILQKDKDNQYYLFSDRKIYFDKEEFSNVTFIEDTENRILKKTPWYVFKLPRLLSQYRINIFWGTQHVLPGSVDKNIKTMLTMHDLVSYELPETMNTYNRIINKLLIPSSINKADVIIAVSHSTKEGILKYFGRKIDAARVKVIYEDGKYIPVSTEQERTYFQNNSEIKAGSYLLYLGTLEPRKNIETLIKAFEILREKRDIRLVLCGKIGWKAEAINNAIVKSKYNKDITYLSYVSDMDKYILMKNCFTFVFPSLYEGFGLPVVEAMKQGAVVVVSDNSSLRELVDLDELKFDTLNERELSEKLMALWDNEDLFQKCKDYCSSRGNDFDWGDIANQYIHIMSSLKR